MTVTGFLTGDWKGLAVTYGSSCKSGVRGWDPSSHPARIPAARMERIKGLRKLVRQVMRILLSCGVGTVAREGARTTPTKIGKRADPLSTSRYVAAHPH
jgi:hypothetical protein